MKRFSLFPLAALAFGVACSDTTTAPAISHSLRSPTDIAGIVGKPPPPPVATAVVITVSGTTTTLAAISADPVPFTVSAPFNGVYFAHGVLSFEGLPTETFDGTAWLRLDNKQPTTIGTSSANARFKAQDNKFTGSGTLMILNHEVIITDVDLFTPQPECGLTGEVCAHIEFRATVDGVANQQGTADAFDKETCQLINPPEGDPYYDCPGAGC